MTTYLIMILDRSGSMEGKESDVIGGFNSFLKDQKKLDDEAKLTTVLFNDQYEVLHDGVDIHKVEPISNKEYNVFGSTALLDAIGRTIDNVDSYVKDDDSVLFFINTDGLENSSHKFNNAQIKEMVTHLQDEHNWKFVFLGANMDAFAVGNSMGIYNSFDTVNTGAGVLNAFAAVSYNTSTYRASGGKDFDTKGFENLTKTDSEEETETNK